jgi:hypothetical protein
VFVTCGLPAGQCLAQDPSQNDPEHKGVVIVRPEQSPQQADEDFSSLLADKPEVPITLPEQAPPVAEPKLPAERSMVINRLCRLVSQKSPPWVILRFLPEEGKPAQVDRYALPNQRLEDMESIVAKDPKAVFRISGECMIYGGRPYLLVRLALTQSQPSAPPEATADPNVPPTKHPATPTTARTSAAADPDDLIRKLLEERPGKPVLLPAESEAKIETLPSVSPAVAKQLPQAFGAMVADRVVYFSTEAGSGWSTVRFVADNTLLEQPIRLLPCRQVLTAKNLSTNKLERNIRLRVSGELTRYKGREYLLLRKVTRERDMHQF